MLSSNDFNRVSEHVYTLKSEAYSPRLLHSIRLHDWIDYIDESGCARVTCMDEELNDDSQPVLICIDSPDKVGSLFNDLHWSWAYNVNAKKDLYLICLFNKTSNRYYMLDMKTSFMGVDIEMEI